MINTKTVKSDYIITSSHFVTQHCTDSSRILPGLFMVCTEICRLRGADKMPSNERRVGVPMVAAHNAKMLFLLVSHTRFPNYGRVVAIEGRGNGMLFLPVLRTDVEQSEQPV